MRVSRAESAGGAISGVCFAPGLRDQLRAPLSFSLAPSLSLSHRQSPSSSLPISFILRPSRSRATNQAGRGEPSIVAALPGMHI